MANLYLIFVYLLAGVSLRQFKLMPRNANMYINKIIVNVSLPALTLLHIPKIAFASSLWMPVSTAWIVYLLAFLFFKVLQYFWQFDNKTLGCLVLCCGLFNSAFIGLPVIDALYGKEGLRFAIMVDQTGSFLVLSTLGVVTAAWLSSGKAEWWIVAKKILTFPPLWGFILALVILFSGQSIPKPVESVLKIAAASLTPLALLSVGLQLTFSLDYLTDKNLLAGLGYKLLLAPFFIFVAFGFLAGSDDLAMKVSVLQSAMGPMISGSILAASNGLNPRLASILVGIGVPISFVTISLWYSLLMFYSG